MSRWFGRGKIPCPLRKTTCKWWTFQSLTQKQPLDHERSTTLSQKNVGFFRLFLWTLFQSKMGYPLLQLPTFVFQWSCRISWPKIQQPSCQAPAVPVASNPDAKAPPSGTSRCKAKSWYVAKIVTGCKHPAIPKGIFLYFFYHAESPLKA